jgi:hypothetical protein
MRPSQKHDKRKSFTLPPMNLPVSLPGAPSLTLEMWMLQPSQREASIALPQLEIPTRPHSLQENWENQISCQAPLSLHFGLNDSFRRR